MRLERAEFEILQQLRVIPEFSREQFPVVHLLLSGGKDSIALLQLMQKLQDCSPDWSGISFSLVAHHFNHKQRGQESELDEQLCIDVAARVGCPIKIWRWPESLASRAQDGENFQALARQWRYDSVHKFSQEGAIYSLGARPSIIATAHHRRDHAETVLHNLARGCGVNGLLGIAPWSDSNRTLRPLLWLSGEQCDQYISKKVLPHREDSSNSSLDYTRNRIRHVVLKELEMLNPKAVEHIWNLSGDVMNSTRSIKSNSTRSGLEDEFHVAVPLDSIQSPNDLHRVIAENCPVGTTRLSREACNNLFTHLLKCLRSPQSAEQQYNFAVSEHVSLNLTSKQLEIKVSLQGFGKTPTAVREQL
ncbi:MAG: tRNA lysidine(34) synthetase TilS [Silvanigrellaceae bacterium]